MKHLIRSLVILALLFASYAHAQTAFIRAVHAIPTLGPVDVGANGDVIFSNAAFGVIPEYVQVAATAYTLQINPVGFNGNVLVQKQNVNLQAGKYYTAAVIQKLGGPEITILEDVTQGPLTSALMRVMNFIVGTESISLRIDANVVFTDVVYGSNSTYQNVSAGEYALQFNFDAQVSEANKNLGTQKISLEKNAVYSIFMFGTSNNIVARLVRDLAITEEVTLLPATSINNATALVPVVPVVPINNTTVAPVLPVVSIGDNISVPVVPVVPVTTSSTSSATTASASSSSADQGQKAAPLVQAAQKVEAAVAAAEAKPKVEAAAVQAAEAKPKVEAAAVQAAVQTAAVQAGDVKQKGDSSVIVSSNKPAVTEVAPTLDQTAVVGQSANTEGTLVPPAPLPAAKPLAIISSASSIRIFGSLLVSIMIGLALA